MERQILGIFESENHATFYEFLVRGSSEAESESSEEDRVKNPSDLDFIMGVFWGSTMSFFNILTEAEGFRDDDEEDGALVLILVVASCRGADIGSASFCNILHGWKFENSRSNISSIKSRCPKLFCYTKKIIGDSSGADPIRKKMV